MAFVVIDEALRLLALKSPFTAICSAWAELKLANWWELSDCCVNPPAKERSHAAPHNFISLPLELLNTLMRDDRGLQAGLQNHWSACEGAAVLSQHLRKLPHPPADPCQWILAQLRNSAPGTNHSDQAKQLLSTVLPEHAELTGSTLNSEQNEALSQFSPLPLRFWPWTPVQDASPASSVSQPVEIEQSDPTSNQETPKIWNASDNLDLNQLGLRSAKSQTDLQGFDPYEGMDPLVPI